MKYKPNKMFLNSGVQRTPTFTPRSKSSYGHVPNLTAKRAKSITKYGMRSLGEGVQKGASSLLYILTKIIIKICAYALIIFGIATLINVFKMGLCFEVLHTKSFILFVSSFGIGAISAILQGRFC